MELEAKINKEINYIKTLIESINLNKNFSITNYEKFEVIGYLYYTYITIDNIEKIIKELRNYESEYIIEEELIKIFNNIILKIGFLKLNISANNTTNNLISFLTFINNNKNELDKFIKDFFKDVEPISILDANI